MLRDIRYGFRTFRNAPLFATGVAGTIGWGLGVICSLVALFNAYVLRPFAVRDPYSLFEFSRNTKTERHRGFSWPEFERLRTETTVSLRF
jgi:hypothetical protein